MNGGIRTPSISRTNSEEKEMRRPDDRINTLSAIWRWDSLLRLFHVNRTARCFFSWETGCVSLACQSSITSFVLLGKGFKEKEMRRPDDRITPSPQYEGEILSSDCFISIELHDVCSLEKQVAWVLHTNRASLHSLSWARLQRQAFQNLIHRKKCAGRTIG